MLNLINYWAFKTMAAALVGGCSKQKENYSGVRVVDGRLLYRLSPSWTPYLTLLARTRNFFDLPENPITKALPPSFSFNLFFNWTGVNG